MKPKISNQDKRLLDIALGYLDKCVNHLTFINIDANADRELRFFAKDIINEVNETKERVTTAIESGKYF